MPAVKKEKSDPKKSKTELCNQKNVEAAIDALKLMEGSYAEKDLKKRPLLENETDSLIFLQIILKKIPPPQLLKMIGVLLPHSLVTETSEICLITGDLDKRNHKAEVEPTVLHYKDILKKHGVSNVTQVIPLRQLRTEYKTFESKRQLAAAYDVFLVDQKIAGVMPKTLGKSFFQSRKFPIQINMRSLDLKEEIKKKLSQTRFSLTCRGNSYSLEVARMSMQTDAILQNIMTAVEVIANKLPGNMPNILSLLLKTAKSKALPIYVSLCGTSDITITKPRKAETLGYDEVSTINADVKVKVFNDGRVIVGKAAKKTNANQDDKNETVQVSGEIMGSEEDTQESTSTEVSSKKQKSKKIKNSNEITDDHLKNIEHAEDLVSVEKSKKTRKGKKSITSPPIENEDNLLENAEYTPDTVNDKISPKKRRKSKKSIVNSFVESEDNQLQNKENTQDSIDDISPKKNKKGKKSIANSLVESEDNQLQNKENTQETLDDNISSKKNKKGKKSIITSLVVNENSLFENAENTPDTVSDKMSPKKRRKSRKSIICSLVESEDNQFENKEITQNSVDDNLFQKKKKGKKSITISHDVNEDSKSKNQTMDENELTSDIEQSIIFKKKGKISMVSEDSNRKTPKSEKKKNKDALKNNTFLADEMMQKEKTPSRSKKGKRQSTEVFTPITSSLSKKRKSNIGNIKYDLK